jgi:hypothetical protein
MTAEQGGRLGTQGDHKGMQADRLGSPLLAMYCRARTRMFQGETMAILRD